MLGSGGRSRSLAQSLAWALAPSLVGLAWLGCGGTETSGSNSSAGSTSTAGSAGTGSGGAGNATLVAKLFSSANVLCAKIAECYPDLQTAGAGSCTAPASGGRKIAIQNPSVDANAEHLQSIIQKCMDDYPDQAEVAAWVTCQTDTVGDNLACYGECPADAEMCANAGNATLEVCHALPAQAKLKACFDASQ